MLGRSEEFCVIKDTACTRSPQPRELRALLGAVRLLVTPNGLSARLAELSQCLFHLV
jgi:hypothetical protein